MMAELLANFTSVLADEHGRKYRARACGAEMPTGRWQGWIEFVPLNGGSPIRSGRETTQPNLTDAVYWANGLTDVYLDGALRRALNPIVIRERRSDEPAFEEPAPAVRAVTGSSQPSDAVLNPFSVYEKGESLLRQQLAALSAWHLVNIIGFYRLSTEPVAVLNCLSSASLIETIVSAVTAQYTRR
jgi:hypothetical protein